MTSSLARSTWFCLATWLVACDGTGGEAGGDAAGPDGTAGDGAAGETLGGDAATGPDAAVPATMQLPRVPADPALTRRIAAGAAMVGGGRGSCTHDPAAQGGGPAAERWCAFSRRAAGATTTELWVVNVSRGVAGELPACDGSSAACLRLSANLWTGTPLWGPSHPVAHRFEGDTLLFHADQAPGGREPYEGGVWAWRPGWQAARRLTSERGVSCQAEAPHGGIHCLDAAVVDPDPSVPFERPRLHEFDLRAGRLEGEGGGPLPSVVRVRNEGSVFAWRARFTPAGDQLVYGTMPAAGGREAVYVVKTAELGITPPRLALEDAADWEIAHDGKKIYFLRGYDRARGENATGRLMLADLPTSLPPSLPSPAPPGAAADGAVELVGAVLGFELVGDAGATTPGIDRGALFSWQEGGQPRVGVLRDRTNPADLLVLGPRIVAARVAADGRHTGFFTDVPGGEFPSGFVARNDGSGRCRLNADVRAETYAFSFSEDARRAFFIEYGRAGSESEEGWHARPESCDQKVKFGDFVFWYQVVRDEFVFFEGGDLEDSTSWLQYTSLRAAPGGPPASPTVVHEKIDEVVGVVDLAGGVWLLFSSGQAEAAALYLHGPLRHPTP